MANERDFRPDLIKNLIFSKREKREIPWRVEPLRDQ